MLLINLYVRGSRSGSSEERSTRCRYWHTQWTSMNGCTLADTMGDRKRIDQIDEIGSNGSCSMPALPKLNDSDFIPTSLSPE